MSSQLAFPTMPSNSDHASVWSTNHTTHVHSLAASDHKHKPDCSFFNNNVSTNADDDQEDGEIKLNHIITKSHPNRDKLSPHRHSSNPDSDRGSRKHRDYDRKRPSSRHRRSRSPDYRSKHRPPHHSDQYRSKDYSKRRRPRSPSLRSEKNAHTFSDNSHTLDPQQNQQPEVKEEPTDEEIDYDFDPDEDPDERERLLIEQRRIKRLELLQQLQPGSTHPSCLTPVTPTPPNEPVLSSDEDDELFTGANCPQPATFKHRSQLEIDMLRAKDYEEELLPLEMNVPQPVDVEQEDDDDDMFSTSLTKPLSRKQQQPATNNQVVAQHADEWADEQGYYKVIPGQELNAKYKLVSTLGKGVFSVVALAEDSLSGQQVAIKLIRNNETMYKAGHKEVMLLKRIMDRDIDRKKHVVCLLDSFDYKGHLCMVFESMSMNLRDVLKKYGAGVGLNIKAVRLYAHQIFMALAHLKKCHIIHADLKPDNILVSESRAVIKVCDLGSACDANENDITPYLVSRFYRAPEIILGMSYDYAIDIWSAACTLYELSTGQILFPGRTNNQMLRFHMETKGAMSHKMIKRGVFGNLYFDAKWRFLGIETDRISNKQVVRPIQFKNQGGPTSKQYDIKARIMAANEQGLESTSKAGLVQLADLIERGLHLNPEKRIGAMDALRHPFIVG